MTLLRQGFAWRVAEHDAAGMVDDAVASGADWCGEDHGALSPWISRMSSSATRVS